MPTNAELKVSRALELFNGSQHTETVSGVARSLGAPEVSVGARSDDGALVEIVVAWELCWYRYEVDLADEPHAVRLLGQGYELSELGEDLGRPTRWPTDAGPSRSARRSERDPNGYAGAAMIYCVVPPELADELFDKLTKHYADDPNVTVIVDQRKSQRRDRGADRPRGPAADGARSSPSTGDRGSPPLVDAE